MLFKGDKKKDHVTALFSCTFIAASLIQVNGICLKSGGKTEATSHFYGIQ